ncbi:ArsR/SmtB family transcription factor [Pararobbsia alpina]|uniref:ArsR/SmtB family transcription factor n=1 Tax=Pararobbsia alpina TaxID=621374 RepID=UPI00158176C2|nr:metalloregulator ArsR/SmtB family transcription factor [Pararobbsia alpina]
MVNHSDQALDAVFAALSDPTRRAVLEQLGTGSQSVTEMAQSHAMSLPGFMKHLRVLEQAGLIDRLKEGRVVHCELRAGPMRDASDWLAKYEKFWTGRLDALGRYLYHQEEVQPWTAPTSTSAPSSTSNASSTPRPTKSGKRGSTPKR